MTMLHAHRGPVSGLTHIHLLRESAEVRAARMAEQRTPEGSTNDRIEAAERTPDAGHRDAGRRPISRNAGLADTL